MFIINYWVMAFNDWKLHNFDWLSMYVVEDESSIKILPGKFGPISNIYLECFTLKLMIAANAWWAWSLVSFIEWRVATDGIRKSTWWANIGVSIGIVCYAVNEMLWVGLFWTTLQLTWRLFLHCDSNIR